jgi:predicted phage tail protein
MGTFLQQPWPPSNTRRPRNEPHRFLHGVADMAVVEVVGMSAGTHIAAALVSAALAAGAAWWAQGQRLGLQIERLQHQQTAAQLDSARHAVADMSRFQKGLDDALEAFRTTQQRNAQAQQDLGRLLLDLRGTTAGLRSDFAGLPQRIATAAKPALAEYASTCTLVFERMAERGEQMASRGAAIAAAADGHAADAVMLQQAWPQKP